MATRMGVAGRNRDACKAGGAMHSAMKQVCRIKPSPPDAFQKANPALPSWEPSRASKAPHTNG